MSVRERERMVYQFGTCPGPWAVSGSGPDGRPRPFRTFFGLAIFFFCFQNLL
jgi:hypothetical protein